MPQNIEYVSTIVTYIGLRNQIAKDQGQKGKFLQKGKDRYNMNDAHKITTINYHRQSDAKTHKHTNMSTHTYMKTNPASNVSKKGGESNWNIKNNPDGLHR